ncbi:predicted protein [Thalassiosira pseudonana CCMP1335]|uniref:Mannosyltransferase n=1 Tax=Thalassiosira pseudonana TaxID=35128 RepID=B8LCX9_THAPS|nr:predicted protein [Thalassiosira pseudonana CCMP1335]EED86613.1 predicted protein [Thalassiosira pseudonana CCMP1335]
MYVTKVAKKPFSLGKGPDILSLVVSESTTGEIVVSATASDSQLVNIEGYSAFQTGDQIVTKVELYLDVHPYDYTGTGTMWLMQPTTAFDSQDVSVELTISTERFTVGRHTLFAQATDSDDYAGPVSAVFFNVEKTIYKQLGGNGLVLSSHHRVFRFDKEWRQSTAKGRGSTATNVYKAQTVYRDEVCEGATAWSYIAPFNALRYNSKSTNLAEHGLHPRVTHAVVNMPMLFGPLALAGYYSIFQRNGRTYNNSSRSIIGSAYLSGLFLLSCAPHQEPRFILPCLVPLVQLYGKDAVGVNATTQQRPKVALFLGPFWVVFNLILYIFFGWLHQGGLVNSLFEMPRPTNESRTARVYVYYKTYMPPSFLARENDNSYNTNAEVCKIDEKGTSEQTLSTEVAVQLDSIVNDSLVQSCRDDIVLDLKGAESSILAEVLRKLLHCPSNTDYQSEIPIYVVSPPSVALSLEFSLYTMQRKYGYPSHISTEDWPTWSGSVGRFIDQLELAVYEVSCSMK